MLRQRREHVCDKYVVIWTTDNLYVAVLDARVRRHLIFRTDPGNKVKLPPSGVLTTY